MHMPVAPRSMIIEYIYLALISAPVLTLCDGFFKIMGDVDVPANFVILIPLISFYFLKDGEIVIYLAECFFAPKLQFAKEPVSACACADF